MMQWINADGQTIPQTYKRPNGDLVVGYDNPQNEAMWLADGFELRDVPEAQHDWRAERLAALSPHFGQVDELVALLTGFGISLPCERDTAKEEVRAAVAADPQRAGDAMKLMDIMIALDRDGITDADILQIATRGEELK